MIHRLVKAPRGKYIGKRLPVRELNRCHLSAFPSMQDIPPGTRDRFLF